MDSISISAEMSSSFSIFSKLLKKKHLFHVTEIDFCSALLCLVTMQNRHPFKQNDGFPNNKLLQSVVCSITEMIASQNAEQLLSGALELTRIQFPAICLAISVTETHKCSAPELEGSWERESWKRTTGMMAAPFLR